MTEALTDATTAELAANNLVAVPRDEWDATQERIDDLETEVDVQASNTKGAHARISKLSERVDDVKDCSTASKQGQAVTDEGARENMEQDEPETWTPLEEIVSLPEEMAARELTANQERARFIAQDVRDYAEKCPAGLVIGSRAIKRVITAKEGTRPHTQTVARVMDFLDELGKDATEQKKRRGKKLVVVDPEAADRLANATADHARCDGRSGSTHPEGVISS